MIGMKLIDMSKHQLLVCGLQWTNPQPPSCKNMIRLLENNEAFVSWVSPNGGGYNGML